jgi:hypothetical protein
MPTIHDHGDNMVEVFQVNKQAREDDRLDVPLLFLNNSLSA